METHGFFENRRGRRLFFAAHGVAGTDRAWVFCNPFLEEKVFSQPVYVAFARRLAETGALVLRFDYEGDGDSEGEVASLSIADWLADIEDACAMVRERWNARRLNLFGLRLGASLGWAVAPVIDAERLVLWDPVLRGDDYLQECLRINLTTQLATYKRIVENRDQLMAKVEQGGTVNIAGYEIGNAMTSSLKELQFAVTATARPALVIHLLRNPKGVPRPEVKALAGQPGVRLETLYVQPFWQESKHYDPLPEALVRPSLEFIADTAAAVGGPA
jgi:exosortase A-associated hydrolase 2